MNALYIFHRDLRYEDNKTLNYLLKHNDIENVIPLFNFDPNQILPENNKYFSNNAVQFMIESLIDMSDIQMPILTYNNLLLSVKKIYKKAPFKYIGFNKDYTPFALKRDKEIQDWADEQGIIVFSFDDTLMKQGEIRNLSGGIYQKFTPYYNKVVQMNIKIEEPEILDKKIIKKKLLTNIKVKHIDITKFYDVNPNNATNGGRKEGFNKINEFKKNVKTYKEKRDFLYLETSGLSPYLKFGCLSVREIYHTFFKYKDFIRQLYWREFYYNLGLFIGEYKYNKNNYNKTNFNNWKNGTTGIPIIDAAMRQLNKTGIMHNRARMMVASYLTKNLNIDWKKGEKYFATKLIDYDPIQNNRNWCYIASITPESQPSFRKFNPLTQMLKYDPDCIYVKRYVDELKDKSKEEIIKLFQRP
jgi:deoxyribodipyrimidine photo-lyase